MKFLVIISFAVLWMRCPDDVNCAPTIGESHQDDQRFLLVKAKLLNRDFSEC